MLKYIKLLRRRSVAYIYKDGKAVLYSTNDVKIPKRIVAKVDSNKDVKQIIEAAIKSVKKANVKYDF
jgi:predicted thioredoxin/glutaredoxin